MTLLGREPNIVLGALAEVIKAVIPMLVIFRVFHWTAEQVAQVMLVVGVSVAALNTMLTRAQTVSVAKSDELIKTAVAMPEGTRIATVKAIMESKET